MIVITYLFNLSFSLFMYFGNAVEIKQQMYTKVANFERTDNITKTVGSMTEIGCATLCLSSCEICKSYNLRRVEGSDVKVCELNGESVGEPVESILRDHYYPTFGICIEEFLVSGRTHRVPDSGLTASSQWDDNHGPRRARLDTQREDSLSGGWNSYIVDGNQWIQADLGELMLVNGVVTQGRWYDGNSQWVTSFKISYSIDGSTYDFIENGNQDFEGNSDSETKVSNMFKAVQARFIKIIPTDWHYHISLRFDVIGCSITQ